MAIKKANPKKIIKLGEPTIMAAKITKRVPLISTKFFFCKIKKINPKKIAAPKEMKKFRK